jgi:hypothetical protein
MIASDSPATRSAVPASEITVILAEAEGQPDIKSTLESVERACAGLSAEVLVVRPQGRPPLPPTPSITVRELSSGDAVLVPDRWGMGVRAATAPVFACLTTEFTVHPDWVRVLLAALATGAVGAAGAIELDQGSGITAAAVFLVRFSPYLPRTDASPRVVPNIPGDTAAYRRDAVVAHPDLLADGFWEVEFHRRFATCGGQLVALGDPLATFRPVRGFGASLVLRYRHGREFGATRMVRRQVPAWRLILGSPLVPVVLVVRIVRRAQEAGRMGLAARAFPALAMISAAWALGEVVGAWSARGRR